MLLLDGAAAESAIVNLRPGPPSVVVRLAPVPATATHAMLTLTADGAKPSGRRVRLRCSAPCGFERTPFGAGADDVHRVRLGSPGGASLELRLQDEDAE